MEYHKSVLLKEVIEYLKPEEGDMVLDATFGFGGHSLAIADKIGKSGKIIGFEQDPRVYRISTAKLPDNIKVINDNFVNYKKHLEKLGIKKIDKAIFDLGISSWHFDKSNLGFSFKGDQPLDMRMDPRQRLTASDIINGYSKQDLSDMFYYLGDEHDANRIADAIVRARKSKKIERTSRLVEIVETVKGKKSGKIHPATKVFQALRIEINKELSALRNALSDIINDLSEGGIVAVISFHSKEDKIVKNIFKLKSEEKKIKIITKKPVVPTREEINANPRSRSAKMRVAKKEER